MSAGPVAVAVAVQLELDHVQMRRPDADTFDIDIRHLLLLSSNTRRNFKLALSVFRAEAPHGTRAPKNTMYFMSRRLCL